MPCGRPTATARATRSGCSQTAARAVLRQRAHRRQRHQQHRRLRQLWRPVAQDIPCVDSDTVQCPLWKANGDCEGNSEWMQSNCRLSCGVCLPPPTKQATPCKDSDKTQCPLWAQNGDCEKNPVWMNDNCPRSCKVCTVSAKVVFDGQHPESADWDGYFPDETSHGCRDSASMSLIVGEPSDKCMDLCADTPRRAFNDLVCCAEQHIVCCCCCCRRRRRRRPRCRCCSSSIRLCFVGYSSLSNLIFVGRLEWTNGFDRSHRYFWAEHTGNRVGYCCVKSSYDPAMGTRSFAMPNGRFYELESAGRR